MKDILLVKQKIETPLKSVYLSDENSYYKVKEELNQGKNIVYGLLTDLISIQPNSKTLNGLLCPFKKYTATVENDFKGYMDSVDISFNNLKDRPYYSTTFDLNNVEDLYKAKYIGIFLVEQDDTVSECINLIKINVAFLNKEKILSYKRF